MSAMASSGGADDVAGRGNAARRGRWGGGVRMGREIEPPRRADDRSAPVLGHRRCAPLTVMRSLPVGVKAGSPRAARRRGRLPRSERLQRDAHRLAPLLDAIAEHALQQTGDAALRHHHVLRLEKRPEIRPRARPPTGNVSWTSAIERLQHDTLRARAGYFGSMVVGFGS